LYLETEREDLHEVTSRQTELKDVALLSGREFSRSIQSTTANF